MSGNNQKHRGKATLNDTSFSRETEQTVAADHAANAQQEPGTVMPHDRLAEDKIKTDQLEGEYTTKVYSRKGSPKD